MGKKIKTTKIIGGVVVIVFLAVIAYFFISSETSGTEIPGYVTGEKRIIYEWAKTEEGKKILEQIPCYCGCKYEGHLHARHCFWNDDGTFDKHGVTCSTCLDTARKAKTANEEGKDICTIRKEIDDFFSANKEMGTNTPMPEGC